MALSDYDATVGNWRASIKRNERKTRWVIGLFVAIYVGLGLICDVLLLQGAYPYLTGSQALSLLVSFQVIPYAMLTMAAAALISIWITFALYNRIMLMGTEYYEVTPTTARNLKEQQLYNAVEEMTVAAGMKYIPKIYVIEASYMNAFASGYSEKSAMVAITRGLMEKLDRAELQAVMAHELSHIRHFDIKVTLMVAVLSNILLIVIDLLFYSVIFGRNDRRENNGGGLFMIVILLRYILPLLTVVLTLFLSRTREYMADSGAVELMRDNEPLARALIKISSDHQENAEEYSQEYGKTAHEELRQASYLFDPSQIDPVKSFSNAFSTHPSLQDRLAAIGFIKKKK